MKNNNKYQERIKFLEKVKTMLDYGYLKEIEGIRSIGLSEDLQSKMENERKETYEKATKEIKEEIGKLLDKYYESDEMEALQKEAEDNGAEIWYNER